MRIFQITSCVLLFAWTLANADHLPTAKVAKGKPDTVLAGVDVYHTTVEQLIKRWGQPSLVRDIPDQGTVAGGRDYIWKKDGHKIDCGTWNDKGVRSIVYSVDVQGTQIDRRFSTGRGLVIGQNGTSVRKIYGDRYVVSPYHSGMRQLTIQWADDTTLYVLIDRSNRVVGLHLLASNE